MSATTLAVPLRAGRVKADLDSATTAREAAYAFLSLMAMKPASTGCVGVPGGGRWASITHSPTRACASSSRPPPA